MGIFRRKSSGKQENITALTDTRLLKIDPQEKGFFDNVLKFKSFNMKINVFINSVSEVKKAKLKAFYRPSYDPSEVSDHMVTYQKGKKPAVGHSYNWWVKTASKMPAVEGRHWHLATEYQYYAFLVWLINQLVKNQKLSVKEALDMVVLDSKDLGHYLNSKDSTGGKDFELTGLRDVCGVYDLANTHKILACSDEAAGGFWIVSGYYYNDSDDYTLAAILPSISVDMDDNKSVGLLVL